MWMIVLGFGVTTVLLAWLLFGYIVWLRFVGEHRTPKNRNPQHRIGNQPAHASGTIDISVVVCCLNEEDLIVEKYRNLTQSTYPADKLEIVFADGGSTDDTVKLLQSLARQDPRLRVLRCPAGGKINQLNYALQGLGGEIVVVTDTDGRLAPDALTWIAAEFEADCQAAVVGACVSPRGGLAVDRCYWRAQNRVRCLESRVSHVSMVIACCYAFRRDLLSEFPDDVIADDVYISAYANTLGYHTVYSARALAEELRTPQTLPEFFAHKFRKSNAVFRELLRFAYRLPEMDGRWKSVLSTRIVQQILLPWGTSLWLATAAVLVNLGQFDVPCLGAAFLLAALLATRKATTAVTLPGKTERFSITTICLAYVYSMAVLWVTGLTYLSFRQSSRYPRLAGRSDASDRAGAEDKPRHARKTAVPLPSLGVRSAMLSSPE